MTEPRLVVEATRPWEHGHRSIHVSELNPGDRLEIETFDEQYRYSLEMIDPEKEEAFIQGGSRFAERTKVRIVGSIYGSMQWTAGDSTISGSLNVGLRLAVQDEATSRRQDIRCNVMRKISVYSSR